jgi:hypothetical protein
MLRTFPLKILPGVVTDATRYALKNRWIASDKIRFRNGFPESVGGWIRAWAAGDLIGVCRTILSFASLSGERHVFFGTHARAYVWHKTGAMFDITPMVDDQTLGANPLATTSGSNLVAFISDRGAPVPGQPLTGIKPTDWIVVSGSTSFGGLLADEINGEREVMKVVGTSVYFKASKAATSTATGGGSAVVIDYYYPTGNSDSVIEGGWGQGWWGQVPWGGGSAEAGNQIIIPLRFWWADNWGEDLIINPSDGPLYYWKENTADQDMVLISSMPGASKVPAMARQMIVSERNRTVMVFACDSLDNPGVQDPLLVRWSDNENYLEWDPIVSGSAAGEFRLASGSVFVAAFQAPNETLAWTDTTLYAIRDSGTNDVFIPNILTTTAHLAGPKAVVSAADIIYWYGAFGFFRYAGTVQSLPCPVEDTIEQLLDRRRMQKIVAGANAMFNEVFWNMVSMKSPDGEPDFYVKFNYADNVWDVGTLNRTAWEDRRSLTNPIATRPDGRVLYHEHGHDDASEIVSTPIMSYVTSGPVEIDENGYHFLAIRAVMPDVLFRYFGDFPPSPLPTLTFEFDFDRFPGNTLDEYYTPDVTTRFRPPPIMSDTGRIVVSPHDLQLRFRGRGRSVAMTVIGGLTMGYGWRLGQNRLIGRPDGRK